MRMYDYNFEIRFEHNILNEGANPYKTFTSVIKIYGTYDNLGNVKECWLQVEMYADKQFYMWGMDRWFESSFSAKLLSFSDIEKLKNLLMESIRLPTNSSQLETEIEIDEGNYYGELYHWPLSSEPKEIREKINSIRIIASPKEFIFIPISNQNQPIYLGEVAHPTIFYSTIDKEINQDRKNYSKLLEFFQKALQYFEIIKYSTEMDINLSQFKYLDKFEYGSEILKHLLDCAKCMEYGILHPALNSFVHAIEWTLITGLKAKGKDIIKEEIEKNRRYHLSELVEESHRLGMISDKMYDRLKNFNQIQRRWSAHHKTGELIEKDIRDTTELFMGLIKEIKPNLENRTE